MWAILGGSGFEKFDQFEVMEEYDQETPFGATSAPFKKVKVDGHEALFLSRHGNSHELLPSEINFRANIFQAKKLGAKGVISVSAVGSLRKKLKPGDLVIPTQYIDRTKSLRASTFAGKGIVSHCSLAEPVSLQVVKAVEKLVADYDFDSHSKKVYVCIEGPNFSTKAESHSYRELGGDIIGMTNFPEYALAREAGMTYLPLSFVTDYDCWDESRPHVTLEEVITVMRQNNQKAFKVIRGILGAGVQPDERDYSAGLRTSLMTAKEAVPKESQEWLNVLL